jgi:hypothetical protein
MKVGLPAKKSGTADKQVQTEEEIAKSGEY